MVSQGFFCLLSHPQRFLLAHFVVHTQFWGRDESESIASDGGCLTLAVSEVRVELKSRLFRVFCSYERLCLLPGELPSSF